MQFIIKVSSETIIKSRSVRRQQLIQLRRNIANVLKRIDDTVKVRSHWDRLEVNCSDTAVAACRKRLGDIPGINSILTVTNFILPEENPLDFLAEKALHYYADVIEGKSFAVRCRRAGHHDFRSIDVERHVGGALLQNSMNSRVQLNKPDITVTLEILHEKAYFVREKQRGLGGYPLGSQGTVLSLISGGFDSSVASYELMRRGCRVHFLFFNLGGTAHSLGVQQAALYLWEKFGSSHSARFFSVSLDSFVNEVMQLPHTSFNGVLLKRAMLRVGAVVAGKIKVEALVTGESLAQVSSQTLANLAVIDKSTDHLVIRPLITKDKEDIIAIAEQIGSAVYARNMVEYCGLISKKPHIAAPLDTIEELETELGDDWFKAAVDSVQSMAVADIIEHVNQQPQVELVSEPDEEIVIDIRATDSPIEQAELHIPFYELNQRFASLAQDREYLLYCDKGVMSQLHAAYLHELGMMNVKVYRPVSGDS